MFASGAKHGVMVRLSVLLIGFVPPLGVGIVALVNFPSAPIVALACAIMGWLLLLLAALDLRHLWLPDWLTVPLGLSGLAANLAGIGPGIGAALIGAAAGFLSLALVAAAYRRVRGRDGLGGGDPKLLAAIGAWTGWEALPIIVVLAAALGLAAGVLWAVAGRGRLAALRLPLGVFLAVAAWPVWIMARLP